MDISEKLFQKFEMLTSRLSPENLHCDGEVSQAEANRRYRQIMKEWRELEIQTGRSVSEEEIENESFKRIREKNK
jgi:hypothetical protein